MQRHRLATVLVGSAILAGCARWEPSHRPGPVAFDRACPLRRAPRVETFGETGVRAIYHFAAGGSSEAERAAFIHSVASRGLNLIPVMVEINGVDTLIVQGAAVLRSQREVDREFGVACRAGQRHVYLTHVRHNPIDQRGGVRVR